MRWIHTLVFGALILGFAVFAKPQHNDLGTARMIEALENIIKEDGSCCQMPSGSTIADYFSVTNEPAAGTSGDLVVIAPTLLAMDSGGDLIRVLYLNITNADHTAAGELYGLYLGLDSDDAEANEYAIGFDSSWDVDLSFANNDGITMQDFGGSTSFTFRDVLAAGTTTNITRIVAALNALDGAGDYVRGIQLDLTNADHSAGNVYGIDLDIDAGDAEASEYAIHITDNWDVEIYGDDEVIITAADGMNLNYRSGGVFSIKEGGNNIISHSGSLDTLTIRPDGIAAGGQLQMIDVGAAGDSFDLNTYTATLAAMDGAGDLVRGWFFNVTNADHSAGNYYGLEIALSANDPDAFETGLFLGPNFDTHITMEAAAASPADNPPAGTIGLYIDDQTDWSGAGGNDCALIARDSGGATDVIATLVLNGACP
jgi:hypothetical protein